jgi:hypothetical protein
MSYLVCRTSWFRDIGMLAGSVLRVLNEATAFAALAVSLFRVMRVLRSVGMAVDAVVSAFRFRTERVTTQDILAGSDWLTVKRIHAPSVSTKVVQHQVSRQRADQELIGHTMGRNGGSFAPIVFRTAEGNTVGGCAFPFDTELPVSDGERCEPVPTLIIRPSINLRPESLSECLFPPRQTALHKAKVTYVLSPIAAL